MRNHTFIGVIIVLIGLSILFHFEIFNLLFALIIVWIGVRIITGRHGSFGSGWSEVKGSISEDYLSRVLVFSGINTKLESDKFEGMELVNIFGGGEVDASDVKTEKKDVDVELVAIFGGMKLTVPKGWAVKSEGVGILGGFDNKTLSVTKPTVTIHLKGVAIFGGVEIIN